MSDSPLTASECLQVLERFTDYEADLDDREAALNDRRVPDSIVLAFVATLDDGGRSRALACCDRQTLLEQWLTDADEEARRLIAFNSYTPAVLLRRLAVDPSPMVRANVVFNPNAEPDVLAGLLLDPSPEVWDAITTGFDTDLGHQLRGGVRSFDFLAQTPEPPSTND